MTQISGLPMTQTGTVTRKFRRVLKRMALNSGIARRDRLAIKAYSAARIAARAEGGMIAVVVGGMDCDGVAYGGRVNLILASVVAYERFIGQVVDYFDGPVHFELERPSLAERIKSHRRDLALEAFEDGRPYALRS